jgi:hypothetical protein
VSDYATKKEISDALLAVGEALQQQDERLAQLEAAVLALKGFLAIALNPSNPAEAAGRIEALTAQAKAKAPGAERRAQISELVQLEKLSEKLGGPKEA